MKCSKCGDQGLILCNMCQGIGCNECKFRRFVSCDQIHFKTRDEDPLAYDKEKDLRHYRKMKEEDDARAHQAYLDSIPD